MNRHLILTAAVFTPNAATLLLSLRGLAAAPSASCFGCTFAHDAAWLAAFTAASWYAALPLLRLPRGNTAQSALAAVWLAAVQLYWLCALFTDRAPFRRLFPAANHHRRSAALVAFSDGLLPAAVPSFAPFSTPAA